MPLGCIGWEIIWALRSKAQHWVIRRLRAIRNVSTHLEWCLRPTGTAFDDRQSWPSLGSRCPRSSPFWQTTAIHLCSSEGHAAFLCPSIQNLPPPPPPHTRTCHFTAPTGDIIPPNSSTRRRLLAPHPSDSLRPLKKRHCECCMLRGTWHHAHLPNSCWRGTSSAKN